MANNSKKGKGGVDDIFMYNFKNNMLLFLLLIGLGLIIWGISLKGEIGDNDKKILAEKFFILKMTDAYKEAEKINKDSTFGKIDVFKINELLDIITVLKNDLSKKGKIENFRISALDFSRTNNKSTNINLTVILNNKDEAFKLINYYIENNILSNKFDISYNNGKWTLTATLQLYYKGKISNELLKKFKEKEIIKKDKKSDTTKTKSSK